MARFFSIRYAFYAYLAERRVPRPELHKEYFRPPLCSCPQNHGLLQNTTIINKKKVIIKHVSYHTTHATISHL